MWLAFAVSILLMVPAIAEAQAIDLSQGDRVRVTSNRNGYDERIATVSRVKGDSIVLLVGGRPASIAIADLNRVDVSTGRGDYGRRGMIIGGLIGAAGGVLGGSLEKPCGGQTPCSVEAEKFQPLAIVVLASFGSVIGRFVGQRYETESWESVKIPGRVSLTPVRGGRVALSLRASF